VERRGAAEALPRHRHAVVPDPLGAERRGGGKGRRRRTLPAARSARVAATHRGNRWGRVGDYFARADEQICLLVQVETAEAAAEVDAICAVDGVDGVFIGPGDLSAAMGHLGDMRHPEVDDAIMGILEKCMAAGKPAGILTGVEEDAQRYVEAGFTFVAVGSDIGLLVKHADALAKRFGRGG